MESLSSETGDDMPTHVTDATNGSQGDATKQSLMHGDSAK